MANSTSRMPPGPVLAKVARKLKPPVRDAYIRVEGSRGDMGWYVVSDGSEFPYRTKIRTGSFDEQVRWRCAMLERLDTVDWASLTHAVPA